MKVKMDDKIKRVVSAAVLVPIIIMFIIIGSNAFKVFISVITVIALFEYRNCYNYTVHKSIIAILLLGFLANTFIIYSGKFNLDMPLLIFVLLLSMAVPIFNNRYDVLSSTITITGFIYIVKFFTFLVLIRDMSNGSHLIWLVFIIAWSCDTAAYYSGRYFGKRKLCPEVSPKKTIEGAIGGIVGSILGIIAWNYINIGLGIPFYKVIILGFIGGIISQIGDLTASLIKRYSGIKDYGRIIPGHGGILDRFDSILFTAPVVYYYIVFFIG